MVEPQAEVMQAPQMAQTPQIFIAPSNLPPPKSLIFDDNLATTWESWKKSWTRYEIATGVQKQEGIVRVSTLLSVIGEDGVKAYDTFTWGEDENQNDVDIVLKKFDEYCSPRTQIIYERYRFNNRNQAPGENIATYLTELRTIARNCAHDSITPDEILRDRLVLGIRDDHVRERLLRLNDLTITEGSRHYQSRGTNTAASQAHEHRRRFCKYAKENTTRRRRYRK
ncbi:Hypothetical predicted protein [Paramuricea clavata]|uniref:Uncharacterized protein n=1 Tax=Paramuricea clavata TaxID=317549 RepID=A0A7D9LNA5_PARCT|nr:Hypothetical predicted protein [Paramuricea clavata]